MSGPGLADLSPGQEGNPSTGSGPHTEAASTVAELLAGRATSSGLDLALEGADGRWTYAELWDRAHRQAADIARDPNLGPVVPLLASGHQADQVIDWCAVVLAGHAVLVVDPAAPEGLRRQWVDAAGGPTMRDLDDLRPVAGSAQRTGHSPAEGDRDRIHSRPHDTAVLTPHADSQPGNLRWTAHRTLLHQARADAAHLGLAPGDRVACLLPLSSPVGVRTIVAAWHAGATAVLFDPRRQGWGGVPDWLSSHHITVAPITPTLRPLVHVDETPGPAATVTILGPPLAADDPELVVDAVDAEDRADGSTATATATATATDERLPAAPAAPSDEDLDPTTAALIAIWQELLDLRPVPRDQDFFELGGYSLLAARMLVLLEQRTGSRLPMAVFLDATTIDQLAAATRQSATAPPDRTVVCVQAGTTARPPLFVTHDLQGSAWRFRPLAEAVGVDQPVYGFESPFLEGRRSHSAVESLAAFYVDAMRRVQPHGPYHVCGYSFGGIMAFEMARILRSRREQVALLGVIDVGPGYRGLDYSRTAVPPLPYLHDAVARSDGRLPKWLRPVRRLWLNQRVLARRWRRLLDAGQAVPVDERLWFAWSAHWKLVGPGWSAADYDGRIDLFWAETTEVADDTDATMGWGVHAAEVVVHPVPGRHESLMAPPTVDVIGAGLRALLDRHPTENLGG